MSSAASGPQAGKSDYNIADETENTPISLIGLEARGDRFDKLNYVYYYIRRTDYKLEIARAEAKGTITRFQNELDRLRASPLNTNETDETLQQRLDHHQTCFERLRAWHDRLENIEQQEKQLAICKQYLADGFDEDTYLNVECRRNLEEVTLPDTVRFLATIDSKLLRYGTEATTTGTSTTLVSR